MKLFPYAHATHPQWQFAAALVLAQLRAQMANTKVSSYASSPSLALLYITDHYAAHAQAILDYLGAELPEVTDWSGTVGVGIASNNVEYFDEPALCVMLCDVPAHQYRGDLKEAYCWLEGAVSDLIAPFGSQALDFRAERSATKDKDLTQYRFDLWWYDGRERAWTDLPV